MSDPTGYLEEFGGFVRELCAISGKAILDTVESSAGALRVERKADDSPVTLADRRAEEVMRARIGKTFPGHGIIAEEFGNENEDAEFTWVLDPIDGTISFVAGSPLYGTLIGLLHNGHPVLGAIHQPVTRQLCLGDGHATFLNGRPARVGGTRSLADALLCCTDFRNVAAYRDKALFDALCERCGTVRGWGDCYGYLLLASGGIDIMLDPIVNPWDVLPVIPIVTGAGGAIATWDGGDPVKGDSCIATSPALYPSVLAALNS